MECISIAIVQWTQENSPINIKWGSSSSFIMLLTHFNSFGFWFDCVCYIDIDSFDETINDEHYFIEN